MMIGLLNENIVAWYVWIILDQILILYMVCIDFIAMPQVLSLYMRIGRRSLIVVGRWSSCWIWRRKWKITSDHSGKQIYFRNFTIMRILLHLHTLPSFPPSSEDCVWYPSKDWKTEEFSREVEIHNSFASGVEHNATGNRPLSWSSWWCLNLILLIRTMLLYCCLSVGRWRCVHDSLAVLTLDTTGHTREGSFAPSHHGLAPTNLDLTLYYCKFCFEYKVQ